jgi:hypothetical protein
VVVDVSVAITTARPDPVAVIAVIAVTVATEATAAKVATPGTAAGVVVAADIVSN